MDDLDRALVDRLQNGIPIVAAPFAELAADLGLDQDLVVERVQSLLDAGVLSRFGPMYNADRMGGRFTLAALTAPEDRFDEIAEQVNAFPEVAHNYARDHELNMWFVVAVERPELLEPTLRRIEDLTGVKVLSFPKIEEYFIDLRLKA